MEYDYKGNKIDEEWFKRVKEKYKQDYKEHYMPQKLKGKGVFKRDGKYSTNIKYFGVTKHLGTFDTEEEATKVYKEALQDFIDNFDDYWDTYYDK